MFTVRERVQSQVRSHRRRRKFAWNSLERSTPICTQSCALYYTTWTFSELFMVSILKATPCRAWRGRMDRLFLKVARVTRSMHHVLSFWFVWVISLWRLHSYSALVTSEGKREPFFFIQATRNVQKCITLPGEMAAWHFSILHATPNHGFCIF